MVRPLFSQRFPSIMNRTPLLCALALCAFIKSATAQTPHLVPLTTFGPNGDGSLRPFDRSYLTTGVPGPTAIWLFMVADDGRPTGSNNYPDPVDNLGEEGSNVS